MPSSRQQFGSWAESVAEDFLRRKGFVILARHVTSRYGEIDILAMDQMVVVAVEVKARKNYKFGPAVAGVTSWKLQKIYSTLNDILQKSYWPEEKARIDIIAIDQGDIRHWRNVG